MRVQQAGGPITLATFEFPGGRRFHFIRSKTSVPESWLVVNDPSLSKNNLPNLLIWAYFSLAQVSSHY
jgi:hypothetical protein